ncbi:MAG: GrpB family protein [Sporolactobacillus sp.]
MNSRLFIFLQANGADHMQGVERGKVYLAEHDRAWQIEFLQAKAMLMTILGPHISDIEHVGSTAVPGLIAKPILDLALITDEALGKTAVDRLLAAGYDDRGESSPPGRHLFVLRKDGRLSVQHLHVFLPRHPDLLAMVRFRDLLIASPELAHGYEELRAAPVRPLCRRSTVVYRRQGGLYHACAARR